MEAQNNNTKKQSVDALVEKKGIDGNIAPETNIKKLRTYKEDLEEAKKRLGIKDVGEKKGWFFRRKKEKEVKKDEIKKEKIEYTKKEPIKELESVKIPEPIKKPETLDEKSINAEVSKNGLVREDVKTEEKPKSSVSGIHTFKTDALKSIENKNESVVSIAAAAEKKRFEKKKENKPEEKPSTIKNIAFSIISLLLIVGGLFSGWYFYNKSEEVKIVEEPAITSLIFSESQVEFDTSGLYKELLRNDLEQMMLNTNTTNNSVVDVQLIETNNQVKSKILVGDFLKKLTSNIPDRLIRSLDKDFMFGIYTSEKKYPFIILKTNSFENAFASMLDWERAISGDLSPLFGEKINNSVFNDVIVKNKDTRILRKDNGEIALIYGFIDAKTILITNNGDVFFEIFKRINTSENK